MDGRDPYEGRAPVEGRDTLGRDDGREALGLDDGRDMLGLDEGLDMLDLDPWERLIDGERLMEDLEKPPPPREPPPRENPRAYNSAHGQRSMIPKQKSSIAFLTLIMILPCFKLPTSRVVGI